MLWKLSELSPQAGHYYKILTSFSDAITLYQHQLLHERKRVASQYMDPIFMADAADQTDKTDLYSDVGAMVGTSLSGSEDIVPTESIDSAGVPGYKI